MSLTKIWWINGNNGDGSVELFFVCLLGIFCWVMAVFGGLKVIHSSLLLNILLLLSSPREK